MENAFAKPTDKVLSTLGVSAAAGLSDEQVVDYRSKYGKNGMSPPPDRSLLLVAPVLL